MVKNDYIVDAWQIRLTKTCSVPDVKETIAKLVGKPKIYGRRSTLCSFVEACLGELDSFNVEFFCKGKSETLSMDKTWVCNCCIYFCLQFFLIFIQDVLVGNLVSLDAIKWSAKLVQGGKISGVVRLTFISPGILSQHTQLMYEWNG